MSGVKTTGAVRGQDIRSNPLDLVVHVRASHFNTVWPLSKCRPSPAPCPQTFECKNQNIIPLNLISKNLFLPHAPTSSRLISLQRYVQQRLITTTRASIYKNTFPQMARTLDSQVSRVPSVPPPSVDHYHDRTSSLPPNAVNLTPGFFVPGYSASQTGPSWNVPQSSSPQMNHTDLPSAPYSYAAQQPLHQAEQIPSLPLPFPGSSSYPDPLTPPMASVPFADAPQKKGLDPNAPPSLTALLPTISSLIAALPSVQVPGNNPASKVAWCRDVIGLVDRLYVVPNQTGSSDPPSGPIHVVDQELNNLVEIAIPMVLQYANPNPVPQPLPLHIAEAIYLRAIFEATGAYPQFLPQNPRMAFRDFERAARAGFSAAWFKLGRDYENFGDFSHAKDCYERGIRNNNESCLYVSTRSFS